MPSLTGWEWPRKPPRLVLTPNIAKSGKRGILRHFRPEKVKHRTSWAQSSDVCDGKYGVLCPRSPMFLSPKKAFCTHFPLVFKGFRRKIRWYQLISVHTNPLKMIIKDGKITKNDPKFALEGTRCLVKIFEGSRAFLQVIERVEMGNFGGSVQFFGSVATPRHGLSPLSQYS